MRSGEVSADATTSHATSEPLTKLGLLITRRLEAFKLHTRAEYDKLAEFDPVSPQLLAQLIQGCLNRGRFGDRVSSAVGRHPVSVAPV